MLTLAVSVPGGGICVVTWCRVIREIDAGDAVGEGHGRLRLGRAGTLSTWQNCPRPGGGENSSPPWTGFRPVPDGEASGGLRWGERGRLARRR